jgi:tetratricopeptide (TPR) repeat protein
LRAHIQESIPTLVKLALAVLLSFLAIAVYAPSIGYDFVYDDDAVVRDNRYVKQGIEGLDEIWSTNYFHGYDQGLAVRAYRPVPLTTLALEYEVWGLNASVNHLFNLLFYALTAFFLLLFLSKLLRDYHPLLPILAALFFVLHPIHIEVVANIKSRDTLLSFLNIVLAAWLLLKHLDNGRKSTLFQSLAFYLVGLFSKEEAITTLALLPLMMYFFRDMEAKKIFIKTMPYAAAVLFFLLIRSSILGGLNEGITLTYLDNSLLAAEGFAERSASNILVLGYYLLKTVFPHPLISDYSWSTIPLSNWNDWRVHASLAANAALLVVGILGLLRKRLYGYAALHYFITISIFSSLVVTNVNAYNDRFLYSPVLGICLMTAWLVTLVIRQHPSRQPLSAHSLRMNAPPLAVVAILAGLSVYKIASHLPTWKDRYTLFEHDVKLAPNNARMRKNHGGSLTLRALEFQESDPEKAKSFARQAIAQLDTALMLYPDLPTGYIHRGNMYIILDKYPEAEESLRSALKYDPDNYFALNSLANVSYRKGEMEAAASYLELIPKQRMKATDYDLLARIHNRLGNTQQAAEYQRLSGR